MSDLPTSNGESLGSRLYSMGYADGRAGVPVTPADAVALIEQIKQLTDGSKAEPQPDDARYLQELSEVLEKAGHPGVSAICKRAAGRIECSPSETESLQAPIAKLTVHEDDSLTASLYAPGLPPGKHDLYCEPPGRGGQKVPHPAFETSAEPIAWWHDCFGVVELSRVQRLGWRPLYDHLAEKTSGKCECGCGATWPSCIRPASDEKAGALPDGCHRGHPHELMTADCERLTEIARQATPERRRWEFDRYRDGKLKAEGIVVHAATMDEALQKALELRTDNRDTIELRPENGTVLNNEDSK